MQLFGVTELFSPELILQRRRGEYVPPFLMKGDNLWLSIPTPAQHLSRLARIYR